MKSNQKKVIINLTFGSTHQESTHFKSLMMFLGRLQQLMLSKHKKNQMFYTVIEELDDE